MRPEYLISDALDLLYSSVFASLIAFNWADTILWHWIVAWRDVRELFAKIDRNGFPINAKRGNQVGDWGMHIGGPAW